MLRLVLSFAWLALLGYAALRGGWLGFAFVGRKALLTAVKGRGGGASREALGEKRGGWEEEEKG